MSTTAYWVCREPAAGGTGNNSQLFSASHSPMGALPMAFSPSARTCSGKPHGSLHRTKPTLMAEVVRPVSSGRRHTQVPSSNMCRLVQSRAGPSHQTVLKKMSSHTLSLNRWAR